MAKILRFQEPLRFEPVSYRGLDTIPVFIQDDSPTSYDYFGITEAPKELTAGRNMLSFTGTKNLVSGAEIAIEVLDANQIICNTMIHNTPCTNTMTNAYHDFESVCYAMVCLLSESV